MNLSEQNILFFLRTMELGGTENVVLQLCSIFKPLVNKIVVCSCGGENVKYLNLMGICHYTIPNIEGKSLAVLLKTAKELRRIIRTEKITVIHTHHRMSAFYVAVLKLYKKCRFINTSHNTFYDKKALTFFSYRHAELIACGEMVKRNLVDCFGFSDSKVTVIRNAVDSFNEKVIEEEIISSLRKKGCFIVGNVGRLSKQKGMEYYIQAVPTVLKQYPNTCFFVIGSGDLEQKLRTIAKELSVEENIYFLGYRKDIQNLMSQLDLVVLSSLWEGLPLTLIEAFSVGRTVIATSVDGTIELVDGKTGILIEPKNSVQIAEQVIWMIEHPKEKMEMEQAARKRYEKEFSMKKFSKEYIKFYKGLDKKEMKKA